jgi:hypothetical protein
MPQNRKPIFAIIILVISLLNAYKILLHPFVIYGFFTLVIGILGVILFFKDHPKYDRLFYMWVYLQLPDIFIAHANGLETPIMNAFPASLFPINFHFGLHLVLENNRELTISLNILPIGLYYLLKYLNVDKTIGKTISIGRLKKGTFPNVQFPLNGTIESIVGRVKMTGIYQICLDTEITIGSKSFKAILKI